MKIYAHSSKSRPESEWDSLEDHLESTANRAGAFAARFGPKAAYQAGLWHDLGKFQEGFQRYLRGEARTGPPHAVVGAWHAARKGCPELAMVIAQHHGQLKSFLALEELLPRGEELRCDVPEPLMRWEAGSMPAREEHRALWMRFVFSALVDADSLVTEEWDRQAPRPRCETPLTELLERLERYLLTRLDAPQSTEVKWLRDRVQSACRDGATADRGAFRLTVPTGGGKTLGSLLFALRHAVYHGLDRVIVVIPYTSIIEQTATIMRDIFGVDAVLEHHSAVDPSSDELINRHCVENWDSPLIVTTSVQFFETLYGNRKPVLRKLHRVAGSVVILDEVQTFPLALINDINDVLERLVTNFSVSTVHCSATQPILAQKDAREIVDHYGELFDAVRHRVTIHLPADNKSPTTWPALADRVREQARSHGHVLVIVHLKRDALDLAALLGEECLHLSGFMCAAHRRDMVEEIKNRLALDTGSCIVVATQLVEAGVDIDFPVVFRALAGVDSLAQAAGRCNRNGRAASGDFHVFVAPTAPPQGTPREGMKESLKLLENDPPVDLLAPDTAGLFFRGLQKTAGDKRSEIRSLEKACKFDKVSELFQMIPDSGTPVIAPYGDLWRKPLVDFKREPNLHALRQLQPYFVNLRKDWLTRLRGLGGLEPVGGDEQEATFWSVTLGRENLYSERLGFGEATNANADAFIVDE